jgi:hypothetical protein
VTVRCSRSVVFVGDYACAVKSSDPSPRAGDQQLVDVGRVGVAGRAVADLQTSLPDAKSARAAPAA